MITATSDVRVRTISDIGIAEVIAGTPLDGLAPTIGQFANEYGVDPNFFLGYCKWENGFLTANTFSRVYNNPFDIICVNAPCNTGNCPPSLVGACGTPTGNSFASGCQSPGNGWCYASYPTLPVGIQAAFWQTNIWYTRDGISPTWGSLLAVAGFGSTTIDQILQDVNRWASLYPPASVSPCGPGLIWDPVSQACVPVQTVPGNVTLPVVLAGVGLVVGGGYVIWRSR